MGFFFFNLFYCRGLRAVHTAFPVLIPLHARAGADPAGPHTNSGETPLLLHQFDRLWGEMPVDAKGRLKYLDFLSRFNSEKVATPPTTGDSAKAQRGSEVPNVSGGGRSAGSPSTRDPKVGMKAQSHLCVSSCPWVSPGTLHQAHSPLGQGLLCCHRVGVTEKMA